MSLDLSQTTWLENFCSHHSCTGSAESNVQILHAYNGFYIHAYLYVIGIVFIGIPVLFYVLYGLLCLAEKIQERRKNALKYTKTV